MRNKVIIYEDHFAEIGGVETHCYNLAKALDPYYDVLVLYGNCNNKQLRRLKHNVQHVEKYDKEKEYTCDVVIRNSLYWHIPENIKAKRYIEMLHADYEWLLSKMSVNEWDKCEKLGCGEFVARQYEKVKNLPSGSIKHIVNILDERKPIEHVYKFISCTRLANEKGLGRMLAFDKLLKDANIKYTWTIFTNTKLDKTKMPQEWHILDPRFDTFDYVADSDYTVLLSDTEGLPYTIQESLQYGTPCIVTDIGGNTELIKDGVNGYIVPLNVDFDINKIKDIPKFKEYNGTPIQTWLDYLGNYEYIKPINKEEIMVKVKAIVRFKDVVNNDQIREVGDEFIVNDERADYLANERELVEIIEEVKETKKAKEVEVAVPTEAPAEEKAVVKKTTTKKATPKKK